VFAADFEQLTVNELSIGITPTKLTETIISNIVSGVASATGTSVSNINLKVYGKTIQVVDNGSVILGTNVTITIGANTSISAAALTVGSSVSAINGYAATNLNAASLKVGTSVPAVNLNAGTNVAAENIASGALAATMTIGAYSPVVGPTSGKKMIQYGTGTNLQTITFSPLFGGTPVVLVTATASNTVPPWKSGVDATNVILHGDVAATFVWMAIGVTP
jgi:hypothetical protein